MTQNNGAQFSFGDPTRQQLQQAEQALRAGQFEQAVTLSRSVLARDARQPAALQILGLALAQRGDHDGAETAFRRFLEINPRAAGVHANLGNLYLLKGNAQDAEYSYRTALSYAPNHLESYFNLGLALKAQDRLPEALAALRKAIQLKPDYADAIVQSGVVLLAMQDSDAALAMFDRALKLRDNQFEAHYNRGMALMRLERWEDAKLALARAAALNDRSHDAFLALGRTLHRLQNRQLATSALGRACALKPDSADAHSALAMVFLDDGWTRAAIDEIGKALALKPDDVDIHIKHGAILADLNRIEEAAAANNRAVELAPDSLEALSALGRSHLSMGRSAEAIAVFERARVLHDDNVQAHLNLARADKFRPGDARLPTLEAFLAKEGKMPDGERASLHFALGRAYDDLGEYDRAFGHFAIAKKIQAKDVPANSEALDIAWFENSEKVYNKALFASRQGTGSSSQVPIFVLGMARSGTTLVEQIVSSHPMVAAAGEVRDLEIATQIVANKRGINEAMPFALHQFSDADLRDLGDTYIERLRQRAAPGAERITDKLLGNYSRVGLIHLTLPRAVMIHCVRNPVDCCLSIYTNNFAEIQDHATDLGQLGRFYRRYHKLMAHWREVLPGAFLDVQYEDTVRDLEGTARRIIAHCGLPWDPRCLDFRNNERRVVTLSITQVRQPIYTSSVDRWRNYEKHLGPLLEGLGDLAPG